MVPSVYRPVSSYKICNGFWCLQRSFESLTVSWKCNWLHCTTNGGWYDDTQLTGVARTCSDGDRRISSHGGSCCTVRALRHGLRRRCGQQAGQVRGQGVRRRVVEHQGRG